MTGRPLAPRNWRLNKPAASPPASPPPKAKRANEKWVPKEQRFVNYRRKQRPITLAKHA